MTLEREVEPALGGEEIAFLEFLQLAFPHSVRRKADDPIARLVGFRQLRLYPWFGRRPVASGH